MGIRELDGEEELGLEGDVVLFEVEELFAIGRRRSARDCCWWPFHQWSQAEGPPETASDHQTSGPRRGRRRGAPETAAGPSASGPRRVGRLRPPETASGTASGPRRGRDPAPETAAGALASGPRG